MKITGIITEYNPFHNGHLYHLNKSREMTNADYIVVVMSGDFMQRGTPAIVNKYERARMALSCGADLVLELPAAYACASAEFFAQGGVGLLHNLGCVNHLVFGSETDDIQALSDVAHLLSCEPDDFQQLMKKHLAKGLTFPQARAAAMNEYMPGIDPELLSTPNNILGLEYLKALYRLNSPIEPLCLKRQGKGYHDSSFGERTEFASATGIRQTLKHDNATDTLSDWVPDIVLDILKDAFRSDCLLTEDDFSTLVHYKLLTAKGTYDSYTDVTPELAARIEKFLPEYHDLSEFTDLLKSRNYTRTRISRCLMHILLNSRKDDFRGFSGSCTVPYARILGFRKESSSLLSEIRKHSAIPMITKVADARKVLDEWYAENAPLRDYAQNMFRQDLFAADVFEIAASHKSGQKPINEYTRGVLII